MIEIDVFAAELFEEAKEADNEEGKKAFLHAALLLGMSSLEAHINAICEEMSERNGLNLLDLSILTEKELTFDKGEYKLTKKLKIYNLTDRILFISKQFSMPSKKIDTNADWWSKVHQGIDLRNSLVHPKERRPIAYEQVVSAFEGIIGVLDATYMVLYKQHFPSLGQRLDSEMSF